MIKFGTSGWRRLIARDFTFENVRVATQAIAEHLNSRRQTGNGAPAKRLEENSNTVLLTYDTRFLGNEFALAAAEVLAANGLVPLLTNRDAPTPVIAHSIRARR